MIKTYFVDSFTTEPFKGNPAGVCIVNDGMSNEKATADQPPDIHSTVARAI